MSRLASLSGSIRSQIIPMSTTTQATANDTIAPNSTINRRNGPDFLSGVLATSKTLTVGISAASSTLAASYCLVRASQSASSTRSLRSRS